MAENTEPEPVPEEELSSTEGEPLPDREVMSIIAPPEHTLPIDPTD
jgi:hypothetical protein